MREYNEIILRPVLYPDGRVHDHPDSGTHATRQGRSAAQSAARRRPGQLIGFGFVILIGLVAL